ncbi:MAG TPA: glucose 1-dehydrogenase [Stellaceae bacterium]|jgi:NAD(P)-dependent dehydrogenase (short-subunit alcohol dehydrogenase family)|nr:glucose 1-dehydrogenase [Stellaceae bacterium]
MADFSLHGRIALVTGASRGLGRHFAGVLARAGAAVALAARDEKLLAEAKGEIERTGGRAVAVPLDVTDGKSVKACVAAVEQALGPIDILVNNAGIAVSKPLVEHSEEDWDRVLDTNLKGAWLMSRELASRWLELKHAGRIINISSLLAFRTARGVPSYAAAKAGLDHLTRTMAVELGRFGITVNAIAPGYVETDMNRDFLRSNTGKALTSRIPAGRVGEPDDLDGALLLLASPAGGYLNGVVLPVDGGHAVSVI